MGEVIGHDSIPGGWYSKNKITILKVLKKHHGYGAFEIDTIKLMNSTGFECFQGLHNDTLGAKYILRGAFDKIHNYNFETQERRYVGLYFKLFLCDKPMIKVDGKMAIGYITKSGNKVYKKVARRKKIQEWIEDNISYDLSKKYKKRYLDREFKYVQTMSLRKVENIIDRTFRGLYPEVFY